MVGGQFDLEMNFIIQEPDSIVCMVELLDKCEPTCQAEIWSIFSAILKKSVRNLQACTDVGLIQLVLHRISTTDSMIADSPESQCSLLLICKLVRINPTVFGSVNFCELEQRWPGGPTGGHVGVLASYSITVKELKLFFSKLQGEKGQWPRHAVKLLSVMKYMAHRNGPDSFFSFPGKNAAVEPIALPPIAKWPYQNGFTFHTWLRMDPLNNINVDKDKPYLYCFRTNKGMGYSAHFVGGCLIVTSLKSKGKGFQHCVKYDFKPQKTFGQVFPGIVRDGQMSTVCSATDGGSVPVLEEALSAAKILAIYQLGPGGDVKAVVTHSVQSGIHSIGGVQSSKVHVTRPVLDIALAFSRYLSNLQNGILLLKQLCDHILFNPAIWIHAPAKVQLTLYTYLATEFISTVTIYNTIRRVGTVLQVMHTLKYYYWVINPQDRSGVVPKGMDGPRPNQKEILSLRAFLLLFVKQLIMKDHGVKEDELQSILNYLLTMHEDDNLMDVLQLLVAVMSEQPGSMVQAFDQRNGIRVIYKLLASKSEGIRVQTLKVMGYFLKHLPPKRKLEVMMSHGLFSLLTERLMLHSGKFTMTTYNVLFEILTEQICTQVIHKQHPDPDSTVKILNPQILKSMEVRKVFLSDMIKLFNNSRENRRSLLQCSVWQEWMLSLCYIHPQNSEEQKITEMVYAIFRILLYHAIKYEWGGWRVWVDTLSITHSKVTFEQHKENLSHMFRQYQHQGSTGSMSSIRTISGVSQRSHTMECVNGTPAEETAPSTVIELTVDELSHKSPDTASGSTITSSPPEAAEGSDEGKETVTQTDDKEEQSEETNKEEQETSTGKSSDDLQTSVGDAEDTNATEGTQRCSRFQNKTIMDQTSPESAACLENIVQEGDSVFNEDLADVSSVSDQTPPSDADDSQEEFSYASAVAGEEGEVSQKEDAKDDDDEGKEDNTEGHEIKTDEDSDEKQAVDLQEKVEEEVKLRKQVSGLESETSLTETPEQSETEAPKDDPSSSITVPATPDQQPSDATPTSTAQSQPLDTTSTTEEETLPAPTDSTCDAQKTAAPVSKTKEIKIARLDVSNVALDTERLELKETSTTETSQEFRWSHMHQRLLADLLFSIETDVQMWRSHSTKTILDFVNSSENVVFVHNSIHIISQVVDNLIMACGGILPLLSAATSSSHELENIEPSHGLTVEASVTFLHRLINLVVDVLIFASSLTFTEIEAEKNMSSGGILRQCLRLVCAMAVRNCLECQQAQCSHGAEASARSYTSMPNMGAAMSAAAQASGMSPVRDLDRLLQDMDINRLRAVVFRDIEDIPDILEPQNDKKRPQRSQSSRSTDSGAISGGLEVENGVSLRRYDSGIGDDHTSAAASEADLSSSGVTHGPDAISEALSTLSSEVRPSLPSDSKGKNVKDILRSLVSAPADDMMVDPSLLPPTFLGSVGDAARDSSRQFRSFDRSVVVAPKKTGMAPSAGAFTSVPSATAASVSAGTPIDSVAMQAARFPASASLPSVPPLSPVTQNTAPNMSISERLENALEKAAPLLREIFVDFAPFLSRTLLGSHGQELLIEGTSLMCMKSSSSVVELVMLLCSQASLASISPLTHLIYQAHLECSKSTAQSGDSEPSYTLSFPPHYLEWQNSIQKNAGLAFIELVNEGRLLSHTMKDHLVRVANEAEFILSRQRAEDIHKHAEFESNCAQYAAEKRDEEKMCDHLIRAAKYRDHVTATQLVQKIVNILTDKHGAWGSSAKR
ncbi:hypothetical protein KUCAC02_015020 [Chaenocephalus aceratus]|uniref:Uncharacterized protein n=1 Tax=Chaenocephalus aceratus TaxID=36190 RepID=A0ACB9XYQ9_CHAAC|nr:hypothetical protein KUCAC02_015020 [Chaenocephalus aceratus]